MNEPVFIDLDFLKIENRQRQVIKPSELSQLADSIKKIGLLHPPVIVYTKSGPRLVAGERRCEAMKKLHAEGHLFKFSGTVVPPGHIPYTLLSSRDATDQFEAEFDENVKRVNLTWQEETSAYNQLHEMRKMQNPAQTLLDTGKEIAARTGASPSRERQVLSRASIVAPHLDDPIVQKARNQDEAYRLVLDKIEKEATAKLEGQAKKADTAVSRHTLLSGDLREVLPTLPSQGFDLIICDPPYGIDAHKQFPIKTAVKHLYDDTQETALEICSFIITEGARILKEKSNLFMFLDIDLFKVLRDLAEDEGYSVWRNPLVWQKDKSGYAPWGRLGFHRTFELILWITRGQRGARVTAPDILDFPKVRDKIHGAQKPVDLYHHLIANTCLPGNTILDPCCGSGTVFPAAERHRCPATGIELDQDHIVNSQQRINSLAGMGGEAPKSLEDL